ncbi:hypothetical protein C6376_25165 [Streptomyces sp. P3]|uniref:hypothetical protein n=1 Tax=Streptomyces sp. P3 TaxID=2135430 RepID=UPI000D1A8D75|nr:hypothetical protein [Streptomyces sp. P3]AVV44237.1 hypothetical protein C6376_25165 [Streptomyces sp. P3]
MQRYEMFIDGESRKATGGEWFPTDIPYLGAPWAEIAQGTEQDVDDAVRAAHRALHTGPLGRADRQCAGRSAAVARRHHRRERPPARRDRSGGHETVFFWYVTACIGLTFLATLVVRESSRTSLLENPTPAPQATATQATTPLT